MADNKPPRDWPFKSKAEEMLREPEPENVVRLPEPERPVPELQRFDTQGKYLITWVGTTNGTVLCNSWHHVCTVLEDSYPNEGDRVKGALLHPGNWVNHPKDDLPFVTSYHYSDEQEHYVVSITRFTPLES